jgi:hypothetical protein
MKPGGRVSIDSPMRTPAGASCIGKSKFPTFALANAVTRREAHNERSRAPYHCKHCGSFHLGDVRMRKANRVKRAVKRRAHADQLLEAGGDL